MDNYYLDNAATTRPKQEVIDAMMPYFEDKWWNPSSLYGESVNVKNDLDKARKIVADSINAKPNEIYFTSCGSESNCWAIQGFVKNVMKKGRTPVIITSKIEHKSIMSCVDDMELLGATVIRVPVDMYGFIDVQYLDNCLHTLKNRDILVSIQYANNECGTIQDIERISEIVDGYGAVFHVDAVQAFGQVDIDVNKLGIDMMSFSGHKLHTPKGIGFLYKRDGIDVAPLIYGSQMDGIRGGTENVPYIMGLAKAVDIARCNLDKHCIFSIIDVRNYFIRELEDIGCQLVGPRKYRLPNNVCIMFPKGYGGEELLYMFDMSGIKVSTGSACNSHSKEPSYVMKALGLTDEEANRVVRFTISSDISFSDINKIVKEIERCMKIMHG